MSLIFFLLLFPLLGICQGEITIEQFNDLKREILAHIKDSTEAEMKVFKTEILQEVKDFKDQSLEITNTISHKLDILKDDTNFIRMTFGIIESIQDDVNAKVSPLERVVNHTAKAVGESVLNELKELRYNITTVSTAHNDGIVGSLDNINDTLRSLVDSANEIKEDIACDNEEHEHQIMSMKNITTELGNNLSTIATQQENRVVSVGNKIEELSSSLMNDFSMSATQQESQLISIISIISNIFTLDQHVAECNTGIIGIHSDLKNYMKKYQSLEQVISTISDEVTIIRSNISEVESNVAQIWQATVCPSDCSQTPWPQRIFPNGCNTEDMITVLCDQESDGGSWTVIQRRKDGSQPRENFNRSWDDYNEGFGDINGEFWLGLKLIHELTSKTDQELLINLMDWEGNKRYAKYSTFRVGPSGDNYKLTISGYSGDAGHGMAIHNGMMFSTYDRDNDKHSTMNCAEKYKGGWWYNACLYVNLNGYPYVKKEGAGYQGILWHKWLGSDYSLRVASMMIRPNI